MADLANDLLWTFAGINPETRTASFIDTQGKERTITWNENGTFSGLVEGTSLDLTDAARANLLNMQAHQIQLLMNPELIPLDDQGLSGRAFIKGTDTIVDLRKGGQFAAVEGIEDVFYDPVSGQFIDRAGDRLAQDKFEFEKLMETEEARLLGITTEQSGIAAAGTLQTGLQGLLDERAISGIEQPRLGQEAGGTLAGKLLEILDRRGEVTAIAQADPGRFVEAEFLRRGLQAPEAREVPLFGDTQLLEGIIQQLTSTQAPEFGDTSKLEGLINDLIITSQEAKTETPVTTAAPVAAPSKPTVDTRTLADFRREQGTPEFAITELDLSSPYPTLAHGGTTEENVMIVGDPQQPGVPNPEIVIDHPDGSIEVIPLNQLVGFRHGTGTVTAKEGKRRGLPHYAHGTEFTSETGNTFSSFTEDQTSTALLEQLQREGRLSGRGLFTLQSRQEEAEAAAVEQTRLAKEESDRLAESTLVRATSAPHIEPTPPAPTPKPDLSTPATITPQVIPQAVPTVPIQTDETFQNLPVLQFLKGMISRAAFNKLPTGNFEGAFGTQLPEAGQLNFNRLQDILNDPITVKLLESLFRSGSRDFGSEVERVKARAPIGQARATSGIRSG